MRRLATAAAALILLAGVAEAQPRSANLRPSVETLEGGLWSASDKVEAATRRSGERTEDAALEAWVKEVACKLASEYCGELRIYVLDRPEMNAGMLPNGAMEVWSGVLLRARTEDEFAFVLGHEIAHFAENHTLERFRAQKNRMAGLMIAQVGIAVATAGAMANAGSVSDVRAISDVANVVSDIAYYGTIASLFGFSREQELQSDAEGFRRAVAAGYDPRAGERIWTGLREETAASSFFKVRRREAMPSIFNTHPVSAERIERLQALSSKAAPDPATADDRRAYRARIRPHLAKWLRDDLRRRDYPQTLVLLDRMAQDGEDLGLLNYMRGEAYRLRRKDGDAALAHSAYAASVQQADAPAESWRALADLQLKAGDRAAARTSYETYLTRAPEAQDRWLVESTLKTLESSQ